MGLPCEVEGLGGCAVVRKVGGFVIVTRFVRDIRLESEGSRNSGNKKEFSLRTSPREVLTWQLVA